MAAPPAAAALVAVPPLALADKLTPAHRRLLAQHDLSVLLQTVTDVQEAGGAHIYNGFFGPARRRIEVVFTEARRDLAQPNLYYLQGKNRYKGIITPFAGTLVIKQVVNQPQYSKKELAEGYDQATNQLPMYTAVGNLVLREDSTKKTREFFEGRWCSTGFATKKVRYVSNPGRATRLARMEASSLTGPGRSMAQLLQSQ